MVLTSNEPAVKLPLLTTKDESDTTWQVPEGHDSLTGLEVTLGDFRALHKRKFGLDVEDVEDDREGHAEEVSEARCDRKLGVDEDDVGEGLFEHADGTKRQAAEFSIEYVYEADCVTLALVLACMLLESARSQGGPKNDPELADSMDILGLGASEPGGQAEKEEEVVETEEVEDEVEVVVEGVVEGIVEEGADDIEEVESFATAAAGPDGHEGVHEDADGSRRHVLEGHRELRGLEARLDDLNVLYKRKFGVDVGEDERDPSEQHIAVVEGPSYERDATVLIVPTACTERLPQPAAAGQAARLKAVPCTMFGEAGALEAEVSMPNGKVLNEMDALVAMESLPVVLESCQLLRRASQTSWISCLKPR
ncbi:unnamed protein product [Prorocentrum cordatum]|uniref:Uncharacterized protein n=1 Tax=Prorocentrum cordatum TaxID=2364126 RepID=A0ABN9TKX7_9DINO|nr:unnamed protein product [Polarella glacialis]